MLTLLGVRCFFAFVKATVRCFEQFGRGATVLWISADADADAKRRLLSAIAQRCLHALRNAIGHTKVGVDQDNSELVAAIASREVDGARVIFDYLGQSLESAIARQMSVLLFLNRRDPAGSNANGLLLRSARRTSRSSISTNSR
jgi:hypothetical protein